jgi:hypothetical protein
VSPGPSCEVGARAPVARAERGVPGSADRRDRTVVAPAPRGRVDEPTVLAVQGAAEEGPASYYVAMVTVRPSPSAATRP